MKFAQLYINLRISLVPNLINNLATTLANKELQLVNSVGYFSLQYYY